MKYLHSETLQIFFISLYSKNNSPFYFFNPDEYLNIVADICDKDLEDCFYFDVNKEKVEQWTKIPHFRNDNTEYIEDTVGYLIQKAINLKSNNSKIEFVDFVEPNDNFFHELILTGHLYNLNFYKNCKNKLLNSLSEYIEVFSKTDLSSDINFCNYQISLNKTLEILDKYYDKYGHKFNINGYEEKDLIKINFEKELKFHEIIFSLIFKEYIEIIDCNLFKVDEKRFLNLKLNFKNSPKEISLIENSYLSYSDLTVNKISGIAYYKKNKYYFRTKSRAFKVLIKLIKSPEKKKDICALHNSIASEDISKEEKKQRIGEYVKEIKRKLNITGDSKTVNIRFVDEDSLMLTKI